MGVKYSHKCNKCGYAVTTSGPWEFYRDEKGNRRPYGHPIPVSEEAEKAGIYGYSGFVYCPDCDQTFDIVLEEYEYPRTEEDRPKIHRKFFSIFILSSAPAHILSRKKNKYKKEGIMKCPRCGNTKLVRPDEENIRIVVCHRCEEGKLMPKREWIS